VEAVEHYRRALALNPNFVEARVNMGKILAEDGRPDEAIAQYQLALARRLTPLLCFSATCFLNATCLNAPTTKCVKQSRCAISKFGLNAPCAGADLLHYRQP
jgi:Tfp pilus assembly protein PilF